MTRLMRWFSILLFTVLCATDVSAQQRRNTAPQAAAPAPVDMPTAYGFGMMRAPGWNIGCSPDPLRTLDTAPSGYVWVCRGEQQGTRHFWGLAMAAPSHEGRTLQEFADDTLQRYYFAGAPNEKRRQDMYSLTAGARGDVRVEVMQLEYWLTQRQEFRNIIVFRFYIPDPNRRSGRYVYGRMSTFDRPDPNLRPLLQTMLENLRLR